MSKFIPLLVVALIFLGCNKDDNSGNNNVILTSTDCVFPTIPTVNCQAPTDSDNSNGFKTNYYDGTNKKKSEGNYENGIATGFWKSYYVNGELKWEGNFSNALRNGFWKDYYENGNVKHEGQLDDCKRNGFWNFYHENGKIESDGNFKNNHRIGTWKFYDNNGHIEKSIQYEC